VSTSSQSKPAASTKPAGDFLSACKAALDADPANAGLVATYLGHAADTPTAGTLRLLATLLADTVKRARAGSTR
jgi:hypothetical protein